MMTMYKVFVVKTLIYQAKPINIEKAITSTLGDTMLVKTNTFRTVL